MPVCSCVRACANAGVRVRARGAGAVGVGAGASVMPEVERIWNNDMDVEQRWILNSDGL